uniref:Uncharacterized protein n=1 Tax=Aplanochytrium stocchinoi TaxID=215587 RepID=A0A6S8FTL1_9STRA
MNEVSSCDATTIQKYCEDHSIELKYHNKKKTLTMTNVTRDIYSFLKERGCSLREQLNIVEQIGNNAVNSEPASDEFPNSTVRENTENNIRRWLQLHCSSTACEFKTQVSSGRPWKTCRLAIQECQACSRLQLTDKEALSILCKSVKVSASKVKRDFELLKEAKGRKLLFS